MAPPEAPAAPPPRGQRQRTGKAGSAALAWTGLALATSLALLAGCATPPPPAPPQGLAELTDRPAERALLAGMRAYDDAQYAEAERQLDAALAAGLVSARDRATAHKLRAFVYCTSQRLPACEAAFRAARAADPGFALARSEAGHPLWGPVYRKLLPR